MRTSSFAARKARPVNKAKGAVVKDDLTKLEGKSKTEVAALVGELVGKRAVEKGVKQVVFDRGGYLYTGRVAALADAARKAGLDF